MQLGENCGGKKNVILRIKKLVGKHLIGRRKTRLILRVVLLCFVSFFVFLSSRLQYFFFVPSFVLRRYCVVFWGGKNI